MTARHASIDLFADRFGDGATLAIRAPGRVNLIGEHTDYNEGLVLPMAIESSTWVVCRPRRDRTVRIASVGYGETEFDLDDLARGTDGWAEYAKGMAWTIGPVGLAGWDGAFASDIPIGAGLSSSAALEIAVAFAFSTVSDRPWHPTEAALAARRCENEWMGLGSGIMDPLIIATAEAGHATLIDCRTLDLQPTLLPEDVAVVILDTGTRRDLVSSGYDDRRTACQRAAAAAGVPALRDLGVDDLVDLDGVVDDIALRRARHVISENERTVEAAAAMEAGDVARLGELMAESHCSLRDDLEVSSPALDIMVDIASALEGCLGARMTGAGFGGCAVALVRDHAVAGFVGEVTHRYSEASDTTPRVYVTKPAAGATVERIGGQTP